MVRVWPTGGGFYTDRTWPNEYRVLFYNFDINGTASKPEFNGLIGKAICDRLVRGWTATVLGLASTTSNKDWNFHLSRLRALAVADRIVAFMQSRSMALTVPTPTAVHTAWTEDLATAFRSSAGIRQTTWNGKDTALRWGVPDDVESRYWRGVIVNVWDHATPPPVVRSMDIVQQPAFPDLGGSILPNALQWLDEASWIESLALADFIPFVDLVLTIIDTMAALPAAWLTGDKLAYQNGEILGYDNAMQDMADAYRDRSLDKKPESEWPPIPRPQPNYATAIPQATVAQEKWREGMKDGCDKAYKQVQQMDLAPKMVRLRGLTGVERRRRLTGKFWLHWLALKYRGNVAVFLIEQWNDYLTSQGHGKWPMTS